MTAACGSRITRNYNQINVEHCPFMEGSSYLIKKQGGSSSQFFSIPQPLPLLSGWEGNLGTCMQLGSNSLETIYILFEPPYRKD
jgi:hypothetical protein